MVREVSFRTVVTGAELAIQTQLDLTALQQAQWAALQVKVPTPACSGSSSDGGLLGTQGKSDAGCSARGEPARLERVQGGH